jgi:uncharacterized protein YcnI
VNLRSHDDSRELFRSQKRPIADAHRPQEKLIVRRLAIAFAAAAVFVLVAATPAFAHVTITPSSAPRGSDAVLTFVAPNEETNGAKTVSLAVTFPQDHPIAEALTQPMAGWTSSVTSVHVSTPIQTDSGTVNDAVGTVTWTAASGGGIPQDQFDTFSVSVGLPDQGDSLMFKAVQKYSDGKEVDWIQTAVPGGDEPPNPAPVLTLTAGEGSTTPASTSASSSSTSTDNTGKTLGIIALIVGGIALILGVIALVMGRRKTPPATTAA